MRLSRWVVRASRPVRAGVGAGVAAIWAALFVVLLALSTSIPLGWMWGVVLAVTLLVFLSLLAFDGPGRRAAARRAGWPGSPDYYARVSVDADHGVLPTEEPARELAYRHARMSWSKRWVVRGSAVVMAATQLSAAAAFVVLGGWGFSALVYGYLTITALIAYPAVVVLPRHRRIIRAVEGR